MQLGAKSSGGEMHGAGPAGQGGWAWCPRPGVAGLTCRARRAGSAEGVGATAGVDAPAPISPQRLCGGTAGVPGGGGGAAAAARGSDRRSCVRRGRIQARARACPSRGQEGGVAGFACGEGRAPGGAVGAGGGGCWA